MCKRKKSSITASMIIGTRIQITAVMGIVKKAEEQLG